MRMICCCCQFKWLDYSLAIWRGCYPGMRFSQRFSSNTQRVRALKLWWQIFCSLGDRKMWKKETTIFVSTSLRNDWVKEANFFGPDEAFIVAGSDCGSVFIWEKETARIRLVRVNFDDRTDQGLSSHNRRSVGAPLFSQIIRFSQIHPKFPLPSLM